MIALPTRNKLALSLLAAIKAVSAALVVGSISVIMVLSYASIIYAGPLSSFIDQGIGLMLIGAIIMALIGPIMLSYNGTLIQPQDITTILISLCAASIASIAGLGPQAAFSTVVMLLVITSLAMGAAAYFMGHSQLGYLVRFMPFPVISGFMAASGVLLIRGAMEMVMPAAGNVGNIVTNWPLWLPWLVAAFGMLAVARTSKGGFGIPLSLTLILGCFYAVTWLLGLDMAAMEKLGLLLGPFEGNSFASSLSLNLLSDVQWWVLAGQLPVTFPNVPISNMEHP